MKIVLTLSVLILLGSCGKYERPFISFKSPEKRLMNHTWRCTEVTQENGESLEVFDHITFEINGEDSVFTRVMDHFYVEPAYSNQIGTASLSIDSISGRSTVTGKWSWAYALNGAYNKQIIVLKSDCHNTRHMRVIDLSGRIFSMKDETWDNATYHYAPL